MPNAPAALPIFDGHNDVLLRLIRKGVADVETHFLDGDGEGHLDLPRMQAGGFGGGLFAVFVPSPSSDPDADPSDRKAKRREAMSGESYDLPLPAPLSLGEAQPTALAMAGILFKIERASGGRVKVCRTAAEIRDCLAKGVLATVLHFEGAEAIDPEFRSLEVLYQSGLRSIGPVWSRPTAFGHGVPFRFPGSPDTGDGLTDLGRDLVRHCNRLRMMIDLSHLNEKGFWDVAELSDAPLVASHSNAHALCATTRNLTDDQLKAIRDSKGLAGVNFATSFLRADGQMTADTGLDVMLQHMDHLIERLGEDGVALGSDFDGATIPSEIKDAAGLPNLVAAMRAHGYGEPLMRKLCWENWVGVLERTWGG
ncbi:dipeptidase [Thalassobaculum sp.]|uniref:dipeptidase n=1 Tax=Thalassobaculum sp. TaxID=2022740 RepID=UPI0032F0007B